jgi:CheY-like chemotaxis protein
MTVSRTRAILVVEDDAAMRHLLVEVLQEAGFLAGCAAGVGGFEILGELNARGKRTRVVLMTSFASPDVVESARAAGAAGVLSKPFGEDQLLEVLEQKS